MSEIRYAIQSKSIVIWNSDIQHKENEYCS